MRNGSTGRAFLVGKFHGRQRGFTLVELVTVIAVVAMLALLCLPAMGRGRTRSLDVGCLNNMRQMATAWRMYAGDNNDRLVPNYGANSGLTGWVAGVMSWSLDSRNTNS